MLTWRPQRFMGQQQVSQGAAACRAVVLAARQGGRLLQD